MRDFLTYLKDVSGYLFKNNKEEIKEPGGIAGEFEDFLKEEKKKQDLPEKPVIDKGEKLDKIEYAPPTDENIKNDATTKNSADKTTAISALEKELELLKRGYETDKTSADKNKAAKEKEIGDIYDNAQKRNDEDSLKRGLARSSIASLTKSGVENERASKLASVSESFNDEITKLDGNIQSLAAKRESALNEFDMTYAAKLTEEINKMKTERQKRMDEVVKYNNSIKEKEESSERERLKLESSLYSDALSQKDKEFNLGQNAVNDPAYNKNIYIKARDLLRSMNHIEAGKLFKEDPIFKNNLNDNYYYMLSKEFG